MRIPPKLAALVILPIAALSKPHATPSLHYTIAVDTARPGSISIEMNVRWPDARDTFVVAMAAHPEYNDRYWRFVQDMRAGPGEASVARLDSVRWRVAARGGLATLRYRIELPPPEPAPVASWRPFVEPTGALIGGYHTFMYIPGFEHAPAHVALDLPASWQLATGMSRTMDPRTFHAADATELMESPFMAGRLRQWRFAEGPVPHQIVWLSPSDSIPFDTTAFVSGIKALVHQAAVTFGGTPWRDYTFRFRDNAYGGLEHGNSVTLGAVAATLARNPHEYLPETAHEYIHAWNLMRIRPAEYQSLSWKTQGPVSVLWFSEGLTLFYSDLLARRAGLPTPAPTRIAHLQGLIERYIANPGNSRLSAETVSRAEYNASPAALGDYVAGSHLQGELIGTVLDIIVRDATDGTASMDDVMRAMIERHPPGRGFTTADVEATVESVCRCDVTPVFDAHIRGAGPIDFAHWLGMIGLDVAVTRSPALSRDGTPAVDLGIWGWEDESDGALRLRISNPENIWGRAGLHTGDRVELVNGVAVRTWPELRAQLVRLRIGDRVPVAVRRGDLVQRVQVPITGYDRPVVTIRPRRDAAPKATRLGAAWVGNR
ncbi:MAG: M61 family metallopeptidase [Gemmatimonadota bacterium]